MFQRLVIIALYSGAAAGLIAGILQLIFVQPVLLHAELYEGGDLVHFGAKATSAHPDLSRFDAVRDGLSLIFTMLTFTGYALILAALMNIVEPRGDRIDGRSGILWGVAGFITFHFAPGLSLAPEVPGVAAADIGARQIWWWGTVISAGIAMWLLAFGRNWAIWGVAVVLLAAPHLIGAPEPDFFTGPAPTEIGALFAARAFGVGLASWVILGAFTGYFSKRAWTWDDE